MDEEYTWENLAKTVLICVVAAIMLRGCGYVYEGQGMRAIWYGPSEHVEHSTGDVNDSSSSDQSR